MMIKFCNMLSLKCVTNINAYKTHIGNTCFFQLTHDSYSKIAVHVIT